MPKLFETTLDILAGLNTKIGVCLVISRAREATEYPECRASVSAQPCGIGKWGISVPRSGIRRSIWRGSRASRNSSNEVVYANGDVKSVYKLHRLSSLRFFVSEENEMWLVVFEEVFQNNFLIKIKFNRELTLCRVPACVCLYVCIFKKERNITCQQILFD